MTMTLAARTWARATFGGIDLGDTRRTARLVRMASLAADQPSGTVPSVFNDAADQQGAYDFLESEHIGADVLEAGHGAAGAASCARSREVLVAVDGSSLTFADRAKKRELGAVGTYAAGARGLKVVTAYAFDANGVPVGPVCQTFWRRPAARPTNRRPAKKRPVALKETQRWLDTITNSVVRLGEHAPDTRATFLVDREGDSAAMLCTLARSGHDFVVRGNWDREVIDGEGRHRNLRQVFTYSKRLGAYELDVEGRPKRKARQAHIVLTSAEVTIPLRDPVTKKAVELRVWAVRAMEVGTCPPGEERIEWVVLTSKPARTLAQARARIREYALRWRIEEFHRAWKSGGCNVEQSQLESEEALRKWAIVLAAVATRIERLKRKARMAPDAPATDELSSVEVRALLLLRSANHQRRGLRVSERTLTLRDALLMIAELGGYTGKSSGGPPGAITLARGLFRLRDAADTLRAMRSRKMR